MVKEYIKPEIGIYTVTSSDLIMKSGEIEQGNEGGDWWGDAKGGDWDDEDGF